MNEFAGVDHPLPGDRGYEIDRKLARFEEWLIEVDEIEPHPDRAPATTNSELNGHP